jgi:rhomboid family protein
MIFPFADNVPRRRSPVVTYLVVLLNFTIFISGVMVSPLEREWRGYQYGFIPARIGLVAQHQPLNVELQAKVRDPVNRTVVLVRDERVLQPEPFSVAMTLFTTMFMHGGWLHLITNMWFLWIFGDNVEDRLGHVPFACFYLAGGLLATLCNWWNDPSSQVPVVGASGAIAAVLGAYMVTWPWARIRSLVFLFVFFTIIELPALLVLGLWFVTQVIEARGDVDLGMGGGVAWWAHIGGFLAGALLMPLVRDDPPEVPSQEPLSVEFS